MKTLILGLLLVPTFCWADLSCQGSGGTLFLHPDSPVTVEFGTEHFTGSLVKSAPGAFSEDVYSLVSAQGSNAELKVTHMPNLALGFCGRAGCDPIPHPQPAPEPSPSPVKTHATLVFDHQWFTFSCAD